MDSGSEVGEIKFFDRKRQFGFITSARGEIFFAARSLLNGSNPRAGDGCTFTVDAKEAKDVRVTKSSDLPRPTVLDIDDVDDLETLTSRLRQGDVACFDSVSALVRRMLAEDVDKALLWVAHIANDRNIAWTRAQRRQLQEIHENVQTMMGSSAASCGEVPENIDSILKNRTQHIVVVLDGLRTPTNIGMIYRTLEGFGIQQV